MTTHKNLRVAVIGGGKMGCNHLRVYGAIKGIELVGVVDPDEKVAKSAAQRFGCLAFTRVEEIIGKVDAVTVATPSVTHAQVGELVLSNGIHCLMEKPLAATREECQRLIELAKKNNLTLMVGHVERFNPAVRELANILKDCKTVHAIDARRMSYASARITDVDVVADLMVHDLDIVSYLAGFAPVKSIHAHGAMAGGATGADHVCANLQFANGTIANVTASRVTQSRVRQLQVTADIGFLTMDFIAQEIYIHRQPSTAGTSYTPDLQIEKVRVTTGESLVQEVSHFVECVKTQQTPLVTGEHGLAALEMVWAIQNAVKSTS